MATRTVRLDDETEQALRDVQEATGLPISEALKRGIHALRERVRTAAGRYPYAVYKELDLGPGGYAATPASDAARGVRRALKRKLGR